MTPMMSQGSWLEAATTAMIFMSRSFRPGSEVVPQKVGEETGNGPDLAATDGSDKAVHLPGIEPQPVPAATALDLDRWLRAHGDRAQATTTAGVVNRPCLLRRRAGSRIKSNRSLRLPPCERAALSQRGRLTNPGVPASSSS